MSNNKIILCSSSSADDETSELAPSVAKYLGRSRQSAAIGDFSDFATTVADGSDNYEVEMEAIEIKEVIRDFLFRSKKNKE